MTVAAFGEATEVEEVFREAYGQAVSTLVWVFGDVTLAEDAVQEACVETTRLAAPSREQRFMAPTDRDRRLLRRRIDDLG